MYGPGPRHSGLYNSRNSRFPDSAGRVNAVTATVRAGKGRTSVELLVALGLLGLGVLLLLAGAELFTEAAVKAARALGITTLALGLLAAGAEPEELFTAALAAWKQAPDIAVGDIVGTNVTILTLALGLGALVLPIQIAPGARWYTRLALLLALPALALLLWGHVPRWAGALLVAGYFLYFRHILQGQRVPSVAEPQGTSSEHPQEALGVVKPSFRQRAWPVGLVCLGVALMGGGANFTVDGALQLTGLLGLAEGAVGLTIVALATSAEMLVLAVVPTLKGHPEISIGAILGSYIFNVTLSLGVAALVRPLAIDRGVFLPSALLMVGLLPLLLWRMGKGRLSRWDGVLLVGVYGLFVGVTLAVVR